MNIGNVSKTSLDSEFIRDITSYGMIPTVLFQNVHLFQFICRNKREAWLPRLYFCCPTAHYIGYNSGPAPFFISRTAVGMKTISRTGRDLLYKNKSLSF